jgi:hypothetical protein
MDKRQFLAAGLGFGIGAGLGAAAAQPPQQPVRAEAAARPPRRVIPVRKAKTVPLFLTPPGWPNAIAVDTERGGFWTQEQRHDGQREKAWLSEFNTGKLLKTVVTNSQNTSGMTYGDGLPGRTASYGSAQTGWKPWCALIRRPGKWTTSFRIRCCRI